MSENASHPGAAGVQHKQRDFYSAARPVPSIQRFFRRGLKDVIINAGEDSEEEEQEEQKAAEKEGGQAGADSGDKSENRKTIKDKDEDGHRLGKLGHKIAEHEQKSKKQQQPDVNEQQQEQQQQHATQRRTHKSRLVDDPITGRKIYIHDVGKREYTSAMQQADQAANASSQGKTSGPAAALHLSQQNQDKPKLSPLVTTPSQLHPSHNDNDQFTTAVSPSKFGRFGSLRKPNNSHQRKTSKSGSLFSGRKSNNYDEENNDDDEDDDDQHNLRADNHQSNGTSSARHSNTRTSMEAQQHERTRDRRRRRHFGSEVENILTMSFPPTESLPLHLQRVHPTLLPMFIAWAFIAYFDVVPRILTIALVPWMAWWTLRRIHAHVEDHRWERERRRGKIATKKEHINAMADEEGNDDSEEGIKEGAEWLNSIMEGLWSVMNPELFSSLGATLEDVMQASIPKFIHAVKVEDLAQGSTPLRLTGFRVLPDTEARDLRQASQKHMQEERLKEQRKLRHSNGQEQAEDDDKGKSQEDAGASFINLELSFIYRARPTTGNVASKNRNAHLLIKFWVGAKKLVTVPLPVWVEIKGIVGSVRTRIQLTPDPPFIKNVTFCFMGLPRVGVEVIPLRINTSNIPLLSGFIQGSIDAAMGEYCAPSSLTMDVGEILMGDNIKREVDALGIVVIYLHSATDLEKQDVNGSSDPYCTLQLAKHGKVQYATRVALDDLSPRWEERFIMLIHPEAVRAREKVSVALWDSDRFSSDDMLGRAEVDLFELVKRPGKLFNRTDTLIGLTNEMKKQGQIHWSVGFFRKTSNKRRLINEESRKREEEEAKELDDEQNQGKDLLNGVEQVDVAQDYHVHSDKNGRKDEGTSAGDQLDQGELQELHLEDYDNRASSHQTRNVEHAVSFEPPDPTLPSGILSMQVHQISQLEVVDTRSTLSVRKHTAAQPGQSVEEVETQEDKPNAPSAYVTIILNDETVFRSRTKALSTNPFYNAGTERFVRDWRRTLIMFVVYDNRLREADAILGVVPIKLTDIFASTSQVTTVFPLAGGVGRGHLRISLLFRPVEGLSRNKTLLGWNIGTMRILSSLHACEFEKGAEDASTLGYASIRAYSLAGETKISSRRAGYTDGEKREAIEWHLQKDEFPIKVPIRRRYATPYVIEFRSRGALGIRRVVAVCILWMQDVSDDDIEEYRLPIWRAEEGGDFHRLLQNYHSYRKEEEAERLGVKRMGYLHVKMQFKSGVGKVHTKFDSNPDAKIVMDAWRACTSMGLRSVTGDFTEMRINTQGMPVDNDQSSSSRPSKGQHKRQTSTASSDRIVRRTRSSLSSDDEYQDDEESETMRERRVPIDGEIDGGNTSDSDGSDSDDDGDTAGDKDDEQTLMDKFHRWTEERKELHRQHRGLKQYKSVRTASWIGRGIRDRSSRALNSMKIQDKRTNQVETEL